VQEYPDGGLVFPVGMFDEEADDVVPMLPPSEWPWEEVMDEMNERRWGGNVLDFAKAWAAKSHAREPMYASAARAKVVTLCYIMMSKNVFRGARNAV
jgi:hypothetical protein